MPEILFAAHARVARFELELRYPDPNLNWSQRMIGLIESLNKSIDK